MFSSISCKIYYKQCRNFIGDSHKNNTFQNLALQIFIPLLSSCEEILQFCFLSNHYLET